VHAKGVLTGTGALPNYMPARGLLQREGKHRDLPKAHPLTRFTVGKAEKKGVTGAGCPAKRAHAQLLVHAGTGIHSHEGGRGRKGRSTL
jgi:hypothetical protein